MPAIGLATTSALLFIRDFVWTVIKGRQGSRSADPSKYHELGRGEQQAFCM